MRLYAFLSSLALLGIGAASYYGWEARGWSGPVLTSAVSAFVGAGMLLGVVVALLLRKPGLQIAFLAALVGLGLGVGRLLPAHLKETLDLDESFSRLVLAMAGVCLAYVLVSVVGFVFRRRPMRRAKSEARNPKPEEALGTADGR